jgi:predicted ArsR family transcriptional regulator
MDATSLAGELGLSPMAVRQHLYILSDEKLVDFKSEARPKGRPAKIWALTEQANALFPDAHAELTVGLIEAMKLAFGPGGVERLLSIRSRDQIAAYGERMHGVSDLKDRLSVLAEIRTEEGYMAAVAESDGEGYLFVENHCPICVAATSCQGLCAMELDVFRSVLGDVASIERTDHIIAGARRCAYRVTPK